MANAPAFQFYAAEYLADEKVNLMTLEQEGAYIRLMAYCWREGSIPADLNQCARLIGKGAEISIAEHVQKCFTPCRKNSERLIHKRLELERKKQSVWKSKSKEGGLKSALARRSKVKGGSTTLAPAASEMVEPNGNSSSSSSSSSSNRYISRPESIESTKLQAAKIGLPDSEAEGFWHFYESKGWKVGKQPMRSWHSAMSGWKVRWQQRQPALLKTANPEEDWKKAWTS